MIGILALAMTGIVLWQVDNIIQLLRVPTEITDISRDYLVIIFFGILATFLYNYYANLLRAVGNSVVPLVFLAVAVFLNIVLDFYFVVSLAWGVKGAALATVISQYVSAVGLYLFYYAGFPKLKMEREYMVWDLSILKDIFRLSGLTCLQQSVMNFGILMVQGLVNSFGSVVMAAFYFGIGLLFMLYGFYRGINRPAISLVLTICSLGTRVLLAYVLSGIPAIGVKGIWVAIPIGWALADIVGVVYYIKGLNLQNKMPNLTF